MTASDVAILPLAALAKMDNAELFRQSFENWGTTSPRILWPLLILLAVVLALMTVMWGVERRRRRGGRPATRPIAVFRALARELGLTWTDQWLLIRIAHHQKLPTPMTLLLAAGTLDHHARQYAMSINLLRRSLALNRAEAIRHRLFGVTPGTPAVLPAGAEPA